MQGCLGACGLALPSISVPVPVDAPLASSVSRPGLWSSCYNSPHPPSLRDSYPPFSSSRVLVDCFSSLICGCRCVNYFPSLGTTLLRHLPHLVSYYYSFPFPLLVSRSAPLPIRVPCLATPYPDLCFVTSCAPAKEPFTPCLRNSYRPRPLPSLPGRLLSMLC